MIYSLDYNSFKRYDKENYDCFEMNKEFKKDWRKLKLSDQGHIFSRTFFQDIYAKHGADIEPFIKDIDLINTCMDNFEKIINTTI